MKNIIAFSIILLCLSSCVKEADIVTEGEPEVITEEGETKDLTGIVRDTSGTILPQASVKIVLNDPEYVLELETKADENGEWKLTVPNTLTEGYVVANKVEYSKSIQRFTETEDNRVKDIYLANDQSNTELDLNLNPDNLVTVSGRIIDANGNPTSDVMLLILSTLDSPPDVFSGFQNTNEDGTFEITYEDTGFNSSTLYSFHTRACSDYLSVVLENQVPVQDLGDIALSYDDFSIFLTSLESDGSSCYENAKTQAYNFKSGTGFLPAAWDEPLGEISLEYCPSETGVFYIGVKSEDNTHFNGLFLTDTEVESSYMFDICTPTPGSFLELNIDGNETIYEDVVYDNSGIIATQNTDNPLYFKVGGWATFTPTGSDSPAYNIGVLSFLTLNTADGVEFNLDEDSSVNYVNIVQQDGSFYAGLIKAKLSANDGSEADMTIRFRVSI